MPISIDPPPNQTRLIDEQTKDISQAWRRFFLRLQNSLANGAAPNDGGYLVTTDTPSLPNSVDLGSLVTGHLSITVALGEAAVTSSATVPASDLSGALPALDASALTALNASALASGTVPQARKSSQITTTSTGTVNNFALSGSDSLRCDNSGGGLTITGFAGMVDGQTLTIWAVSANTVTLNNQDAGSDVANRIITPTGAAVVLTATVGRAVVQYDGTTQRVRVLLVA